MRRYIIIVLIILLVGATYLTNFFISKKHSFDENLSLKWENENLRVEIQMLQSLIPKVKGLTINYLTAEIFSTYPFNVKNQITVNAGKNQGVKKTMAVAIGENILLGQVINVFADYSVVKTIFDPNFQLPVRVGEAQVDGLFQGGNEPKMTLIEKSKSIKKGDVVYSASQEFPYGLKIGEINEIKESAAGVFKEATLTTPFNINELREVNIIINPVRNL